MDSQEQQTASLHQQASEHYLQGEFAQALQVWRQLLELDPNDERAEEGMRLCELLAEDDAVDPAAETTPAESPPASPAVEAPVEVADVPDLQFDFADVPEPQAEADSPAAGSDFDFGELADAPAATAPPVVSPAEIQFDLDLDGEAAPAAPATAASNELQTRIQELFAEAEKAHADGELETALSVLSRLFILDENYEPALALQAAMAEGDAAPAQEPPAAEIETTNLDDELDLDEDLVAASDAPAVELAAPSPQPAPAPVELTPDALPAEEEPPPPLPLDDEGEDEFSESVESMPEMPATMPSVPTASGSKLAGKGRWIAIGAAVLLLAAAGFFFGPRFFGGDPAEVETAEAAEPAPVKKKRGKQSSKGENDPAPLPTVPIGELITKGDAAMESGDHATAAIFFGDAVRLEADHEYAKQQLRVAGEELRAQQELEQKWADARNNFTSGNYRLALATFYRLPESEQSDQLERFKVNGWFNMGREALMRGDCKSAREHFKEARSLDAEDEGVAQGLALIDDCKLARKPADYPERLQAVALRAMDD